jgi:hypothetical protein
MTEHAETGALCPLHHSRVCACTCGELAGDSGGLESKSEKMARTVLRASERRAAVSRRPFL